MLDLELEEPDCHLCLCASLHHCLVLGRFGAHQKENLKIFVYWWFQQKIDQIKKDFINEYFFLFMVTFFPAYINNWSIQNLALPLANGGITFSDS